MKSLVIAVTTLALAGIAYAQAESQTAPATSAQQIGDAAAAAADVAADEDAFSTIDEMPLDPSEGAGQATEEAGVADEDVVNGDAEATVETDEPTGEATVTDDRAAEEASDGAEKPAEDTVAAVPAVTPPDVKPPAISEADPGVLSSWVISRRIWTTNQPSSTEWVDPLLQERPPEWQEIAKINDIVLDDSGQVVGYIADIGGFLGIGAKKVLLGTGAIHLLSIGNDTFFATNYTKQELEALPDFDQKTVRN